jgi:hypothetical protein
VRSPEPGPVESVTDTEKRRGVGERLLVKEQAFRRNVHPCLQKDDTRQAPFSLSQPLLLARVDRDIPNGYLAIGNG